MCVCVCVVFCDVFFVMTLIEIEVRRVFSASYTEFCTETLSRAFGRLRSAQSILINI